MLSTPPCRHVIVPDVRLSVRGCRQSCWIGPTRRSQQGKVRPLVTSHLTALTPKSQDSSLSLEASARCVPTVFSAHPMSHCSRDGQENIARDMSSRRDVPPGRPFRAGFELWKLASGGCCTEIVQVHFECGIGTMHNVTH